MKILPSLLAGASLLLVTPSSLPGADPSATRPQLDPVARPTPGPVPHSPYAGRYAFAAVDLRGERRTAGVGFIAVAPDSTFRGYIRNHETGKVARFAGRVMRNGKLEFIPDFENVRQLVRILRRRNCVHGLAGRYIIHHDPPLPTDDDPMAALADDIPEPGENGDAGADEVDLSEVIRTAGVVIGYRR
jgi:hypothetical protein